MLVQSARYLLGDKKVGQGRINEVFAYKGLEKVSVSNAEAGDIVIVTGEGV